MSDYPVWWDTTITIYNKYTNPLTKSISWFSYIIDGCFWDNTSVQTFNDTAQMLSNDVICRIRENDLYKPRGKWQDLPNDMMGDYFTLGKDDILINGEVTDVIDENTRGHRATDLIAKYKNTMDCIVIKKFSDNTGAGRVLPHYYVVGE